MQPTWLSSTHSQTVARAARAAALSDHSGKVKAGGGEGGGCAEGRGGGETRGGAADGTEL
jgi:hypothetical protein